MNHVDMETDHITLQTQYGNILRMVPEGESPLLLPANKHKQLVVIDFEYANANLPGLEFANHFVGISVSHCLLIR
jgi:thiamine kinase-like enzyme